MAYKIAYGAGHGRHTAGKRLPVELDPDMTREWVLNDRIARHFAQAAGAWPQVQLLRVDDPTGETNVSLAERCRRANEWGADMYLSIHHNAGIKLGAGGGIVAYIHPEDTGAAPFRDAIYDSCIAAGGLRGNRAKPLTTARFQVLGETKAPAVLMEYGFMDSATDAPVILTDSYARAMAIATMAGIAQAAGLTVATATDKTDEQLAREVLQGRYGNGQARRERLGERYEAVQALVNRMCRKALTQAQLETLAKEVILGRFGNGQARKQALQALYGAENAAAIQAAVNKMLKEG